MPILRINQDGSFETDDLDTAVAFYERLAARRTAAVAAPRAFFTNTPTGLVAHTPVAKVSRGSLPDGVTEKVASLIEHARSNPDTIGILATLQSAGGGEVTTPNLALAIGLDDTVKLSGKLAGIVKTANRLGLDPALIMVRDSAGYNANRVITYCAGKGLLAAPPLRVGGFDPADFGGAAPRNGGAPV